MKRCIPLVLTLFFASPTWATGLSDETNKSLEGVGPFPAIEADLTDFKWQKRPIVVFADSPDDPRFREQIELLQARQSALKDRDVVILTDADPAAETELRTRLRPRGFMLVLIGKDGGVKLRKPFPWSVREISRSIDKMPLRRKEIRDRGLNIN